MHSERGVFGSGNLPRWIDSFVGRFNPNKMRVYDRFSCTDKLLYIIVLTAILIVCCFSKKK